MSRNKIPSIFVSVAEFEKVLKEYPKTNAVILEARGYAPILIGSDEIKRKLENFSLWFPSNLDSLNTVKKCIGFTKVTIPLNKDITDDYMSGWSDALNILLDFVNKNLKKEA